MALGLARSSNAAAPANDSFANAQLITGASGSIGGSNVSATKQGGEPDHAGNSGGRSVWYRWQANCSGTLTLDTPGVSFNTLLAVYTGTSLNSLVQVATNVHGPVTFSLTPGQVYQIAIDGSNGVTGSFTLAWSHAFNGTNGPDLTIWGPSTVPYIVKKFFNANDCEVQEGCVIAGDRRLLRFALETRNIGNEDLVFGDPANSPLFKYAACHQHYHFTGFATYRLLDSNGVAVAVGNKNGFCLEDYTQWNPLAHPAFYNCNFQGIQVGWSDIYTSVLPCQYIDITGIPPGNYTLDMEIDTLNHIVERNKTNKT